MLLDGIQIEEIARLEPGEAYFYTEGLHSPRRVRCLDANAYLGLLDYVDAPRMAALLSKEDWFAENRTDRIAEAGRLLAETNEVLEQISAWCKDKAAPAMGGLYDRWQAACAETASGQLSAVRQQGEDIIKHCVVFQDLIHEKTQCFMKSADRYARISRALVGDHENLQSVADELKARWIKTEQPQLASLYHKLETLETGVRNMIAAEDEPEIQEA